MRLPFILCITTLRGFTNLYGLRLRWKPGLLITFGASRILLGWPIETVPVPKQLLS